MTPLTLRWEWRAFGDSFGEAEARLRTPLGPPRVSTETYLVAPVRNANVKIRDDLLDLKQLDRVDRHGLELWRPVLKSPFPLAHATLASIIDAWSLPRPDLLHDCASPGELVAYLKEVAPRVVAVQVTKARAGAVWHECQVEIADLTFDSVPIRTLAVEMTNPEHLWATVQELGLEHHDNENYVRALQRFIAQGASSITR
jgi:exopolyphosphatase / guanosine-5'-triphosphate,3'-diphosphate pyrophosphatase